MAEKRVPINWFVEQLKKRCAAKDGYIMGATGQNPKNWKITSWWFSQYSGAQKTKALYWREHAERVWDCNGMAEGLYKDYTGVDINTKARYNYAKWCSEKGSGRIPASKRVPGMAVFKGNTAATIHHVGYLVEPVVAGKPDGDWYIIEAKGCLYGVVKTKLYSSNWTFWGKMDKYFDYGNENVQENPSQPAVEETKEEVVVTADKYIQVTGTDVNIRAGAGTSYKVLLVSKKGDKYKYLGEKSGWTNIDCAGVSAWIYTKYTKIV